MPGRGTQHAGDARERDGDAHQRPEPLPTLGGHGPDAAASWRDGAVSRVASGQFVAPKASAKRFIIRAHCKVAGDAHDTGRPQEISQTAIGSPAR